MLNVGEIRQNYLLKILTAKEKKNILFGHNKSELQKHSVRGMRNSGLNVSGIQPATRLCQLNYTYTDYFKHCQSFSTQSYLVIRK